MDLEAFRIPHDPPLRLVSAPVHRPWLTNAEHLRILFESKAVKLSNRSGWLVLNSHDVELVWDGGDARESTTVRYQGLGPYPAASYFGYGVVTWGIPFLFRTPEGYNLQVRGPSNYPKDGILPLDGVVETDWSPAPFTMNWKLTRPNFAVRFEVGEPICMVTPVRRGGLESLEPVFLKRTTQTDCPEAHLSEEVWVLRLKEFHV